MKNIALTTLFLIFCSEAFAGPLQVEIKARYEGFDPYYAELGILVKGNKPINVLSTPRPQVTTTSGRTAMIRIGREAKVPETPKGEESVDNGFTLEVLPVVKDSQITLSGKSVLRRRLVQDSGQPLGAVSFATQETFFSGVVEDGKELAIAVDDGPKHEGRIFLTVQLIAPPPEQAHAPAVRY